MTIATDMSLKQRRLHCHGIDSFTLFSTTESKPLGTFVHGSRQTPLSCGQVA